MRALKKHFGLLIPAIILIATVITIYPFYQYYIDPDATAYLTIASRYANGNYIKAINGYWSPWSIWLTSLFIKLGYNGFVGAIVVNTLGAVGFLAISYSLFTRFKIGRIITAIATLTLAGFLAYAIFWQSFADLWECFFLLCILRLFIRDDFTQRPALWVASGFLGALAYFAKAYSMPFLVLAIFCCSYFVTNQNNRLWLKIAGICILTMIACSSPWIYALYVKYGILTTGSAGSLNMSWYLVGHPYWKPEIVHLLPPVYPDSPSYWEDPATANGEAPYFWSSFKLFTLQIVRTGYNTLKFFQSINELSAFFAFTLVIGCGVVFFRKVRNYFDQKLFIVSLSFLLFPVGYFLVNFQGRYLWYMVPLSLLLGAVVLNRLRSDNKNHRTGLLILFIVFCGSFLVAPAMGLKEMFRKGQLQYEQGQWLKQRGITGTFTTNIPYGPRSQEIVRLAYFSGSPCFSLPSPASLPAILAEMRRYNIKYFFHFSDPNDLICELTDESGRPFPEVTLGELPGLKVYLVNP